MMPSLMKSPSTPPLTPPRGVQWRSLLWLSSGLVLLALCFVLWIWLQVKGRVMVESTWPDAQQSSSSVEAKPEQFDDTLGAMTRIVAPLDLTESTTTVMNHAPEFRGGAFIKTQSKSWTLQLMNVTQESVVTDYLARRNDRSQFYYFRTNQDNQERFVLTYGIFNTVQTAMGALQTVDFALPASVKAMPERFSAYQGLVTDQGNDERVRGVTSKVREVRLRAVAAPTAPTPAEPAKTASSPQSTDSASSATATDNNAPDAIAKLIESRSSKPADGFADEPDAPPAMPASADEPLPAVQDPF